MAAPTERDSENLITEKGKKKPCRACVDFQSWVKLKGGTFNKKETIDPTAETPGSVEHSENAGTALTARSHCPLDREALGRNTWSFLHTMAAYYPDQPSHQQQNEMKQFMTIFGKFFPCDYCATDFSENLKRNPPQTASQNDFSQWMCRMHNHVNRRVGKPQFDCTKVNERWRDGWSDGSCD